jgi:hypothetical protein
MKVTRNVKGVRGRAGRAPPPGGPSRSEPVEPAITWGRAQSRLRGGLLERRDLSRATARGLRLQVRAEDAGADPLAPPRAAAAPALRELVFDNYNFFVIGFSPTERPSDTVVSLAAASNGVGLSFYRGASLRDPHGILLGSGVQNRFIRLPSASVLAQPEVEALIEAAVARTRVPFAPRGRGQLIIRSVSKKQRPRRRGGA